MVYKGGEYGELQNSRLQHSTIFKVKIAPKWSIARRMLQIHGLYDQPVGADSQ